MEKRTWVVLGVIVIVLACALTAVVWGAWWKVAGSVPLVRTIGFLVWQFSLPIALSRWWDVAGVAILAGWIVVVFYGLYEYGLEWGNLYLHDHDIEQGLGRTLAMLFLYVVASGLVMGILMAIGGRGVRWQYPWQGFYLLVIVWASIRCRQATSEDQKRIKVRKPEADVMIGYSFAAAPVLGLVIGLVYGMVLGVIASLVIFILMCAFTWATISHAPKRWAR